MRSQPCAVAPRCYTLFVPTKRPRLTITETPDMTRRLSLAAAWRPELAGSRNELLLLLTEIAERTLEGLGDDDNRREAAKRRLLTRTEAITAGQAQVMLGSREADWAHGIDGW